MTPSLGTAHSYEVQGNQMIFHREFDYPRELVYQAWTDPQALAMWYGPDGFRTETHAWDFREGGIWEHTMHGPNGDDYPHVTRFHQIVPNEKLVYRLDGKREDDPHGFDVVVDFIDLGGSRTRLDMTMTFASAEVAREVESQYGAIAGHQQTMQRLENLLPAIRDREVSNARGIFTLAREFAAPIDLVWACWTEADKMQQWFGPEGFSIPHCEVRAEVGGRWHLAMRDDSTGHDHWCGGEYLEVVKPTRLVYTDYFASPEGDMLNTADIGMADYPSHNTVTVQFEAIDAHTTRMLLTSDTPLKAAQTYWADFGWGSSFVKLARLLLSDQ